MKRCGAAQFGMLAASFALLALAPGCGERGPQPFMRVDARLLAAGPTTTPDAPTRCSLGGVGRPAIGCLPRVNAEGLLESDDRGLGVIAYRLAVDEWNDEFVVERRYRLGPDDEWQDSPTILWRGRRGRLEVPFAYPPGAEPRVFLRKLPRKPIDQSSSPRTLVPGALLVGEIGVQTPLRQRGGRVRFRVEAVVEGGAAADATPRTALLFEQVVDPDVEGDRWLPYRIDLTPLAGLEVRFRFASEPASARRPGRSFATFSGPRLLEPDVLAPGEVRDILLISFDTLRADHVGTYGSRLETTPHLDRFAETAVVFETAQTTFPTTTASHMSLFTGLYPRVHRVPGPSFALGSGVTTLPESLAAAGFATSAVTENGMIAGSSGFERGFDAYREFRGRTARDTQGHVAQVVDAGLAWLSAHPDERAFLFLHTYQVHGPYGPPPAYDRFQSTEAGISPLERDRRAYAGEVLYADAEFQRLLDGLDALGRLDSMAIVFTSDHGEGFGEHSLGHGNSLFEEEVRIPLMLRVPGWEAARRAPPVSLVDLAPTVLDLVGLEPDGPFQGRSLRVLAQTGDVGDLGERAIYAERAPGDVVAVRKGTDKWILGARRDGPVRFDLAIDPSEQNALVGAAELAVGEALLREFERDNAQMDATLEDAAPSAVPVDEATEAELRALGYIE